MPAAWNIYSTKQLKSAYRSCCHFCGFFVCFFVCCCFFAIVQISWFKQIPKSFFSSKEHAGGIIRSATAAGAKSWSFLTFCISLFSLNVLEMQIGSESVRHTPTPTNEPPGNIMHFKLDVIGPLEYNCKFGGDDTLLVPWVYLTCSLLNCIQINWIVTFIWLVK